MNENQATPTNAVSNPVGSPADMICGQVMGEMLQLGWKKSQLDALEIMFWSVRDGNGEVIAQAGSASERGTTG